MRFAKLAPLVLLLAACSGAPTPAVTVTVTPPQTDQQYLGWRWDLLSEKTQDDLCSEYKIGKLGDSAIRLDPADTIDIREVDRFFAIKCINQ